MVKILVLGGGYVGLKAADRLRTEGYEVQICSRKKQDGRILWEGKITGGFDTCLFCAAPDSHSIEDYKKTYLENAKILANSSLQRIIYTSSTSVYPQNQGELVSESEASQPIQETSKILYETEKVLLASDKHVLCFRLGEIIGPGRSLRERLEKVASPLPGDGNSITNLSPLEDIVNGIAFGLKHNLSGIYNLVSDTHLPRKVLYESLFPDIALSWDPTLPVRHGGSKIVSNAKLKSTGFLFSNNQPY